MKIVYETEQQSLKIKNGDNLLELCLKNNVPIDHSCEGGASCGTCRVLITEGLEKLPPRNTLEQEMADDRNFEDHERLACQLHPISSFKFVLPKDL